MFCCGGKSRKTSEAARAALRTAGDVFSDDGELSGGAGAGTSSGGKEGGVSVVWRVVAALVLARGDPRAVAQLKDADTEEVNFNVLQSVISMRNASAQLGEALKEKDKSGIYVKGHKHLFACHDVGDDMLLVFYLEGPRARDVRKFDVLPVHLERLKNLCAELEQILRPS